jgi:phosphoadenosine phosphosulfate reductase
VGDEVSLIEQGLFGTVDKVQMAIDRIQTFCPPEGYYVAFSGGKDSVVILDLVKRSGVPFDAHYNITGIDPPELFYFIRDNFPEVQRHRPEKTMWKLIEEKRFPPNRKVRYCCEVLKEHGGHDRYVVTGVRWSESSKRSKRKILEACFRDSRKFYLNPIVDWSDSEVWAYIHGNALSYCKLYDEGFKRLGCIMCPMSSNQKTEAERYPRYKTLYLKAMDRCIKKRITDGIPTKWTQAQEMYDWWINNRRSGDPDQTVMFE